MKYKGWPDEDSYANFEASEPTDIEIELHVRIDNFKE